jgi:predicted transcriptional regulator of viral defense system
MREKKRTDDRGLGVLATQQHGVVSARQLRELGFSENLITIEAKRGRLRRVHRGVYAVGHEALTWDGWCMAAVLANSRTVASHWSAGWLWGLLRSRPSGRFHLMADRRRHRRPEFNLHVGALLKEDIASVRGIPVTSLPRTVLDLAATEPGRTERDLKTCDDAKLFDLREFHALLSRSGDHEGHTRLARAVELYRPDPSVTRSGLERRFRELVREAGLAVPAMNYVVAGYELDCWWEEARLAVELDTFGTHGSRLSFEEDRKRQRVLGLLGITVERVTDRQLDREPGEVLRMVATRLGAG